MHQFVGNKLSNIDWSRRSPVINEEVQQMFKKFQFNNPNQKLIKTSSKDLQSVNECMKICLTEWIKRNKSHVKF